MTNEKWKMIYREFNLEVQQLVQLIRMVTGFVF